jgi:hypothetical protein
VSLPESSMCTEDQLEAGLIRKIRREIEID